MLPTDKPAVTPVIQPSNEHTPSWHPAWARIHLWQIQWVRDLLVVGMAVGIIYVGYLISVVTVPLLLAVALAYLFEPVVRNVVRRNICSRQVAAAAIIVLAGLMVVLPLTLGSAFAVVQGTRAVTEVTENISKVQKSVVEAEDPKLREEIPPGAWRSIRDALAKRKKISEAKAMGVETIEPAPLPPPPPSWLVGEDELRSVGLRVLEWLSGHVEDLTSGLGKKVASSGAAAARAAFVTVFSIGLLVFQAFLTAMFFYFLSTGWGKVLDFSEQFIPDNKRQRVMHILQQMDRAIAGFVRGRVTICFVLGVVMTLAYWVGGVPVPLIVGPVVGLLFMVPYLSSLSVPITMLLMWLQGPQGPIFGGDQASIGLILVIPIGLYLLAQFLDDWVLSPTIQGKVTDLDVPVIVFASIAGGALAGVYGLLVAIPAAACLKILIRELFWPRLKAWAQGQASDVLPIDKQ